MLWKDIIKLAILVLAIFSIILLAKLLRTVFSSVKASHKIAAIQSQISPEDAATNVAALTFAAEKAACLAKIEAAPYAQGLHFLDFIYVAGTRYYDKAAAGALKSGDFLQAIREPTNPHDCNAICLKTQSGAKIGYVPRRYNSIPVAMIDRGYSVCIKVYSAYPSPEAPVIRAQIHIGKAVE